ncbi:MAG: molybdate ABC transporter substrate-binding protein [Ornithinimicrobium sp.]
MKGLLILGLCLPLTLSGCVQVNDGTVTILAASSLADVMPQIVELAEQDRPDETFEVSYAGSSQIVQQLNSGVDADVVILAGEGPLESLDADLARSEPSVVATNILTIALAPGNPAGITSVDDLARDDVTLVLCADQVPCGDAAAQMLALAKVIPNVASYEPDVRATLAKVASGEADAGVVYVTDAASVLGSDIETVAVPTGAQVENRYPAFSVDGSEGGAEFVALLTSDDAQEVLAKAGFGAP